MSRRREEEARAHPGIAFQRAFDRLPTRMARAPGRVNLIGEHTDYNGLPVFPMAIQRELRVYFAPRDDRRIRLVDCDAHYPPCELELSAVIEPFEPGHWGNYAKAAAQMLVRDHALARGLDALVYGDIPPAAGLSSSSATVVAITLALADAASLDVARQELMRSTARAERYVGVESGGMDQAISLGGRAGHALVIDFDPLHLRPTPVPNEWRFVIANSLVSAEKAGLAKDAYNRRVRECRAALDGVLALPEASHWPRTWRGLVETVAVEELVALAERALDVVLARRFRHVVTEGARVELARRAMLAGDRATFGALMNASHESLAHDYEVSCSELDRLVELARAAGADGARLTGAGFGGCIVALCDAHIAASIVDELSTRHPSSLQMSAESKPFVAIASDGATVQAFLGD